MLTDPDRLRSARTDIQDPDVDRLLVVQAQALDVPIITADHQLGRYDVKLLTPDDER